MATQKKVYETLLEQIQEAARDQTHPLALLTLAEAFAWLRSPAQPHGDRGSR